MKTLANISLREYRALLTLLGLTCIRSKGGHEAWMKPGMTRPVIVQTHVDPVPERVVRSNMHTLGLTREELLALIEK